ncbi:uncharacterized protein PHA67_000410 isoform 1-T1 [Liasis olivaceus]
MSEISRSFLLWIWIHNSAEAPSLSTDSFWVGLQLKEEEIEFHHTTTVPTTTLKDNEASSFGQAAKPGRRGKELTGAHQNGLRSKMMTLKSCISKLSHLAYKSLQVWISAGSRVKLDSKQTEKELRNSYMMQAIELYRCHHQNVLLLWGSRKPISSDQLIESSLLI